MNPLKLNALESTLNSQNNKTSRIPILPKLLQKKESLNLISSRESNQNFLNLLKYNPYQEFIEIEKDISFNLLTLLINEKNIQKERPEDQEKTQNKSKKQEPQKVKKIINENEEIMKNPEIFFESLEKQEFDQKLTNAFNNLQEIIKVNLKSQKVLTIECIIKDIIKSPYESQNNEFKISRRVENLSNFCLNTLYWQNVTYLVESINYLNPKRVSPKELERICQVSRTKISLQIFSSVAYLYFIALFKIKNSRVSIVKPQLLEEISMIEEQFKELLQKNYFLLMSRLHRPKDKILELLALLVGKSLFKLIEDVIVESMEEIYGIFGFQKQCQLFVYQFVMNLFCGVKSMDLSLSSVDQMFSKFFCDSKQQNWQTVLYNGYHKQNKTQSKIRSSFIESQKYTEKLTIENKKVSFFENSKDFQNCMKVQDINSKRHKSNTFNVKRPSMLLESNIIQNQKDSNDTLEYGFSFDNMITKFNRHQSFHSKKSGSIVKMYVPQDQQSSEKNKVQKEVKKIQNISIIDKTSNGSKNQTINQIENTPLLQKQAQSNNLTDKQAINMYQKNIGERDFEFKKMRIQFQKELKNQFKFLNCQKIDKEMAIEYAKEIIEGNPKRFNYLIPTYSDQELGYKKQIKKKHEMKSSFILNLSQQQNEQKKKKQQQIKAQQKQKQSKQKTNEKRLSVRQNNESPNETKKQENSFSLSENASNKNSISAKSLEQKQIVEIKKLPENRKQSILPNQISKIKSMKSFHETWSSYRLKSEQNIQQSKDKEAEKLERERKQKFFQKANENNLNHYNIFKIQDKKSKSMPKQQENNISKMSENTKIENEKKEVEIIQKYEKFNKYQMSQQFEQIYKRNKSQTPLEGHNGAIQKNKNRNLQISNSKFQLQGFENKWLQMVQDPQKLQKKELENVIPIKINATNLEKKRGEIMEQRAKKKQRVFMIDQIQYLLGVSKLSAQEDFFQKEVRLKSKSTTKLISKEQTVNVSQYNLQMKENENSKKKESLKNIQDIKQDLNEYIDQQINQQAFKKINDWEKSFIDTQKIQNIDRLKNAISARIQYDISN